MTAAAIPFLDLEATHLELEEELVRAFREALRSARFIGGPEVEGFEREFATCCGTRYAVGVGSGTDALRFALSACGVAPGDAVLTVAHTFIATVEAISQAGGNTEFVDIDEHTYNMSPAVLASYLEACQRDSTTGRPLGQRTGRPLKAIVPVHLYGQIADMDAIVEVAEHYDLIVVEDACQAHGAEYRAHRDGTADANQRTVADRRPGESVWRRAGSIGRAAAFSFYPGKNLGACGEAGAVTTNDEQVAQTVRMLRDHGQVQKYYHDLEGYNGRLDAIQAAFLRIKLRQLDDRNSQRRSAAARYNELFAGSGLVTPVEPSWSRAVYHLYVVRAVARGELSDYLRERGIHTGFHYPVPVHLQSCYREWGYRPGDLPVTERVASEVLSLPMFPGLKSAQQERVAEEVGRFMHVTAHR